MPELRAEALISDMDGVLIDSGGMYVRHWERWADRNGVDPEHIMAVHSGRPAVETIKLVASHLDAPAEARRYNADLALEAGCDGVVALAGAAGLLRALPAGRWAIATSAQRIMAERWLDHVGLPRPAVLVSIDDVVRGKPWPDPYLRAAELLGVAPERCIVIEDAPAGIAAARAAGATVLAVRTTHADVDLGSAHHRIDDLDEISVTADDGGIRLTWR